MDHKVKLACVMQDPEVESTFCSFVSNIRHKSAKLVIITNMVTKDVRFEVRFANRVSHGTFKCNDISRAIEYYNNL